MGEWRETILGSVVTSNNQSINKDYEYDIIQYLDTGSITNGKIDGYQEVSASEAPSRAKRLVKHEDIIYSTVRPIQRHFGFIQNPANNLVVSTGFSVIEVNKELANPKFIYYFLSSDETVEILDVIAEASTTTYPSLKPKDIEGLDILLPLPEEQKAIAEVLSSLDDKIDLLHRQNKTLEELAQTLFRQWFIEEAKEEWEEIKLGDFIKTELGGTPNTSKVEYWDGDIPWINSGEINKFRITQPTKYITELGLQKSSTKLLPKGTTVLAITGATLGQVSLLEINSCANQSVIGVIPNDTFSKEFIYLWIKEKISEIISNQTGGAQQHINKNDVNDTLMIKPDNSFMKLKTEELKQYFEKISINVKQIQTLENLRDTLLPKLLSGEARVQWKS